MPAVLGEGGTACVVGPLRFAAGHPELSDDKDYAGKVFARASDCAEELALAHAIRLRMIDYFKGDVKAAKKFCLTHLVLPYTSTTMTHEALFGDTKPCSTVPKQESYCVGVMRPIEHTLVSYLASLPTAEARAESHEMHQHPSATAAESLPLVRSAVRDILDTLHAAHVYHGDVRAENVGFYTTGKGRVHICLLDFGTATVSTDGPHRHQQETDLRAAARLR